MAPSSATHIWKLLFLCCGFIVSTAVLGTSAHRFVVGGSEGWIEPTGNETETYNDWAVDNRFQVGDSLYFKYRDDSVLVVEPGAYDKCDSSDPISKYDDGNTTFVFDRYGFFYFISGAPGHCVGGQKLIVQVMGQSEAWSPEGSSAAPSSGGGVIASPPPSGGEDEPPSSGDGGAGGGDDGKGGSDDSKGSGGETQTPSSSSSSSTKLAFGLASALTALAGVIA